MKDIVLVTLAIDAARPSWSTAAFPAEANSTRTSPELLLSSSRVRSQARFEAKWDDETGDWIFGKRVLDGVKRLIRSNFSTRRLEVRTSTLTSPRPSASIPEFIISEPRHQVRLPGPPDVLPAAVRTLGLRLSLGKSFQGVFLDLNSG